MELPVQAKSKGIERIEEKGKEWCQMAGYFGNKQTGWATTCNQAREVVPLAQCHKKEMKKDMQRQWKKDTLFESTSFAFSMIWACWWRETGTTQRERNWSEQDCTWAAEGHWAWGKMRAMREAETKNMNAEKSGNEEYIFIKTLTWVLHLCDIQHHFMLSS